VTQDKKKSKVEGGNWGINGKKMYVELKPWPETT
jgi:hypothetical protein